MITHVARSILFACTRGAGVILFILICNFTAAAEQKISLEKVSLQLKWFHQFQFAGYYAALEKGYYLDEGLDVEIIEGGPKIKVDQVVTSGEAEYGVLASELILRRAQGEPVVLLAVIMQHSVRAIIVRADSGINSPAALAGHSMMLNQNEDAEFLAMFKSEGVPLDTLNIISKDKTGNNKFIQGQIQALNGSIANQPFIFENKGIPVRLIRPINYGVDFYGDSLFTSEAEILKHPDRADAFRRASLKGWEYAMAHPDEIVDLIVAEYNPEKSREHLKFEADSLKRLILPKLVDIGHINPHRIDRIAQIYKELNVIGMDGSIDGLLYNPKYNTGNRLTQLMVIGLLVILTFGLLIGGILVFFNRRLKKLVKLKTEEMEVFNRVLQRNFNLLSSFIEGSVDPIYVKDTDGCYILVNTALANVFGIPADEIVGKKDFEVLAPEIASQIEKNDRELLREKNPIIREEVVPVAGTPHVFLSSKVVFYDNDGNTEGLFGISHDVTDMKQAQEALRQSEEQLRSIAEASPDYIIQLDRELKVQYINRTEDGVSREEIIGTPLYKLAEVKDQADIKKRLESVMETGQKVYYETEYQRSDKENISFESIAAATYDSGKITGLTVISRDVTQRNKAEKEKKKLEFQLNQFQKMEAIGTLAGGIAHDFNNILSAILGYTELVREDTIDGTLAADNLDQVLKASQRAKTLVKQILTFSKQSEQKLEYTSIASVVEEAIGFIRASIPASVDIQKKIDSECGTVLGDSTQIHQVVMNLCTNAYHAMLETGGVLGITLSSVEIDARDRKVLDLQMAPGNYVKLEISDTGCGMERSTLDKIFDPYFTTKEKGDGSGMGLAVTHGIVQRMGGHIAVDSEFGLGTKFKIFIPKMDGEAILAETGQDKDVPSGKEHILFVDDEELIANMGKQMLERIGYHVSAVSDSREALAVFEADPAKYDVVITDMAMPEMDGAELSQKIMTIRPDIPIVLCTGFSDIINGKKAKAIGIRAFLAKPVTRKEMTRIVRRVLDSR